MPTEPGHRSSWSAPNIEFDKHGKRIRPGKDLTPPQGSFELCRSPLSVDGDCLKRCGERCEWGR